MFFKKFLFIPIIIGFVAIVNYAGAAVTSSCSDSDNGLDYFTAGKTTVISPYYGIFNFLSPDKLRTRVYGDICAANNYLIEYACKDTAVYPTRRLCAAGCQNGVCLPESASSPTPTPTPTPTSTSCAKEEETIDLILPVSQRPQCCSGLIMELKSKSVGICKKPTSTLAPTPTPSPAPTLTPAPALKPSKCAIEGERVILAPPSERRECCARLFLEATSKSTGVCKKRFISAAPTPAPVSCGIIQRIIGLGKCPAPTPAPAPISTPTPAPVSCGIIQRIIGLGKCPAPVSTPITTPPAVSTAPTPTPAPAPPTGADLKCVWCGYSCEPFAVRKNKKCLMIVPKDKVCKQVGNACQSLDK